MNINKHTSVIKTTSDESVVDSKTVGMLIKKNI